MNEFRRDPVTGRMVIISAARDARPNQFQPTDGRQSRPADDRAAECQFCASQMNTPPMVASYGEPWQVCVVPNLFPSLDATHDSTLTNFLPPAMFESAPAIGNHEVVIESPTHVTRSGDLTLPQIQLMLRAYRDRMQFMREQPGVAYVQVIKNSGEAAGASLPHVHSQIFAVPFVPEQVQRELDGVRSHFDTTGRCIFCDIIERESREAESNSRVVERTDDYIAWCPHASRVGFETHIAPRKHAARFEDSSDEQLDKLAPLLLRILQRLDQHPRIEAFNYLIHSLPTAAPTQSVDSHVDETYHWHIEILPRIAKEAGFEWGTGIHINTIAPEQAAIELRLHDNAPRS